MLRRASTKSGAMRKASVIGGRVLLGNDDAVAALLFRTLESGIGYADQRLDGASLFGEDRDSSGNRDMA